MAPQRIFNESDEKVLKLPSSPEIVNRFGYPGSRFRGNERAFNIREAASCQDHIQLSGQMPFPMGEGETLPRRYPGSYIVYDS